MKNHKTYKTKYYEFTTGWSGFDLKYHLASYFDSKPMLQIYFIWGKLFLYLPWKHYKKVPRELTEKEKRCDKLKKIKDPEYKPEIKYKKELYDECDYPIYGIYIHSNALWLRIGEKAKSFDFPWQYEWIRTSALRKDGEWEHETKGNRKEFWENKWKNILFNETHPYKYITKDGSEQHALATITVREREWRWKWFKWLKLTRKIIKDIDIEFNTDIGEGKGSWKGGYTGCSYKILPNETPYDTLKRMEKERKF